MSAFTRYASGQWNTCCPRCGFRFKSGKLRREWTGLMVCASCYDPHHPLDQPHTIRSERSIPWTAHELEGSATPLSSGEEGITFEDLEIVFDGVTEVFTE